MLSSAPFALIPEMLEVPDLLRRFDPLQSKAWAAAIGVKKRLLVTGEGSSRIFPAKNLRSLSLQNGGGWHIVTDGAATAAEYDLRDFAVLGASNSGRTQEVVSLFKKLKAGNIPCYGVTATAHSPLTEIADCRVLACGAEKAVAATKSVVEQALVYQSLLSGAEWKDQHKAAELCAGVLAADISKEIVDAITGAPLIYFSGRNNGVAEELTLKTNEILRRKSDYLEGTYALHGIEEVMRQDETLVLIEPFKAELEKYQKIIASGVGLKVIAIASFDTPFPTVKIPALAGFNGYFQLLAGWNVLVSAGLALGLDLDHTIRARKVGNAV